MAPRTQMRRGARVLQCLSIKRPPLDKSQGALPPGPDVQGPDTLGGLWEAGDLALALLLTSYAPVDKPHTSLGLGFPQL